MIATATAALAAGLLFTTLKEGWLRLAGLLLLLGAGAYGVLLEAGAGSALCLAGPAIAIVLLTRPGRLARMDFEPLMMRAGLTVCLLVAAFTLAARLPVGDLPWQLAAPLWSLGALGLSWVALPREAVESAAGAVLVIGAGAGLMAVAWSPGLGALTAGLAGAMALMPLASVVRPWIADAASKVAVLLMAAVLAAAIAAAASGESHVARLLDLRLLASPTTDTEIAFLLLVALLGGWEAGAPALLGALSIGAENTILRWTALTALIALSFAGTGGESPGGGDRARTAWAGAASLALGLVLPYLVGHPLGERWGAVLLAAGWLMAASAAVAQRQQRVLVLPTLTFWLLATLSHLPAVALDRFRWVMLAGAAAWASLSLLPAPPNRPPLRTALTLGLLGLVVACPTTVSNLAALLLLLDLCLLPVGAGTSRGMGAVLARLASSGWPPSPAFAGRVLATIGVVSASVPLGAVAAALVAALQLAPLGGRRTELGSAGGKAQAVSALGLVSGAIPAGILRLLGG